jgi:hypothetical protein
VKRTVKHHIGDALELAGLQRTSWERISARIAASGVPTCDATNLRERLRDVEAKVTAARTERAAARQARDRDRDAYAKARDQSPSNPLYQRALRSVDALAATEARLEELTETHVGILKMLGEPAQAGHGGNGPRSGDGGTDGFATIARELSLAEGRNRVNLPLGDMLRSPAMAAVTVTPSSGLSQPSMEVPFVQTARDERHIWQAIPPGEPVDIGTAAITDYKQTGSRTVTGSVERDPIATTSKAKLGLAVSLENLPLKQFAVVVNEVPAKLFDFIPIFQQFLVSELSYQISLALDAHVLAEIAAASPPTSKEGSTLIEQCRNAVAAMRKLGAKPSVLALSPADAAALDVQKSGTEGLEQYIFATRDTGSSSPLYGNTIIEVPVGLTAPVLLDPMILGAMYSGMAMVQADPFTGLDTNEVRLRVEAEALCHIRDIQGAHVIST